MTDIIQRELTAEEKAERAKYEKEQPEREKALAEESRRAAYQQISDPVYFQWQRGEKTEADYLAAVDQVRAEYPVPELPEDVEEAI